MRKPIRIACNTGHVAELDDLHILQKDLKDLTKTGYERLAREIEDTGYAYPIHVWRDINNNNKLWIVAGTQRKRVLTYMRDEKEFVIPPLPIVIVEADNIDGARGRVLQDVSVYGDLSRQGLYEFATEAGIDIEELTQRFNLPLDMESFKFEYYADPIAPGETASTESRTTDVNPIDSDRETYLNNNIKQIVLFYDAPKFESVINRANSLLERLGIDDFSALFLHLISQEEYDADDGVESEDSGQEGADPEDSPGE